jgi:hypothetical protein
MIAKDWQDFKSISVKKNIPIQWSDKVNRYDLSIQDGNFRINYAMAKNDSSDQIDFETNFKPFGNSTLKYVTNEPFSSKKLPDGKSLFTRITGVKYDLVLGANNCYFTIPYPVVKMDGVEVIGGEYGDRVSLWILDTESGELTTIPNYPLDQFGINVGVSKDFYRRESKYEAELTQGIQVWVDYNSVSAKNVVINYLIHEVK